MRITNKIIQNNSLTNINNNKTLQDKLSTQIATEKKISRPSEDPIIALRSLRLRTSVSQTEQYREKNAEDAESWLTVTEDSINTLSEIITDMRKQYVKGASDTLTSVDRGIILENLESLAAEVYNTGNADFAGRSIFTGYRTSSTLTFQKEETINYEIFEDFTPDALDTIKYVNYSDTSEYDVYDEEITRFRTSYKNLDNVDAKLMLPVDSTLVSGTAVDLDGDGTNDALAVTPERMSSSATPNPYDYIHTNPDKIVFVPETGEILLGKNIAGALEGTDTKMTVSYERSNWMKGDLRPEHYFKCQDNTTGPKDDSGDPTPIKYNFESSPEAEICYNIGVNQSLRINTNASECFTHDITRDIDDLIATIKEVDAVELKLAELQNELKGLDDNSSDREAVQKRIDAVKKSQTFLNDKLSKMFGAGITKAEGYLTKNNLALTNCGTRSKRLELIQNRLDTQLSTLKELKSENEDVDMAETAVKLSSAEYAYDAALMATSKILKESLLNYL